MAALFVLYASLFLFLSSAYITFTLVVKEKMIGIYFYNNTDDLWSFLFFLNKTQSI